MTWINTLDPILLSIGPLEIRWYGVMYALSFIFVYYYVLGRIRKQKEALSALQLDTLLIVLVLAMLLGARILEVLFYNPTYYLKNPWSIFAIWQGGLSFHGGLLGILIAALVVCRRWNLSFFEIADTFIVPLSLTQALGRLGNFFNHEVYGRITTSILGVNFRQEVDPFGNLVYRHPSQLYEAFYDVVIFLVLYLRLVCLEKWDKKPVLGTQFALFLICYGFFRSITEFLWEPDFYLGPVTAGQFLNIPMVVSGGILYIWLTSRKNRSQGSDNAHL